MGIVGYGKLGKAVEKNILKNKYFNLIKIFSRRKLSNCEDFNKIERYKKKIQMLFICVGSQSGLEDINYNLANSFNLIDVYDNHSKLKKYVYKLNTKSKENQKVCLCALGWDPGIFSLIRGLFNFLGFNYITTWGKGVSQGHTNAIKNINGVIDSIQFTVPVKKQLKLFKNKGIVKKEKLHLRKCYVVANKENQSNIKRSILNMEHYFKGYKTKVQFVSQKRLNKLKTDKHKGEIIVQNNKAGFFLNLKSNPEFTAHIMVLYAKVMVYYIKNKEYGAYTIFDIPIKKLIYGNEYNYL